MQGCILTVYQTAGSGGSRVWDDSSFQPHLGEEPVHKHSLVLSKPVDPEDALNIIGGVPRGVKDDHPVSSNQVDPQRAGPGWNEKQTTSGQVQDGRHKSEGID